MGRPALAGRPRRGDHGWVDRAAVLRELEQGDLALTAPRLGGMARAGGVVIVSQHYWAYAGVDGSALPRPRPAINRKASGRLMESPIACALNTVVTASRK